MNTGALPMPTTVPMATPVRATPPKKHGWYAAIATAAASVGTGGHDRSGRPRRTPVATA